jgi:hypothetical protein
MLHIHKPNRILSCWPNTKMEVELWFESLPLLLLS